jgi:aldehyde:ferredoxin oxidoreductase
MKQELNLNCFDCNKSSQDCTCMEDTIDMKQETIEEAAERLYPAEWDWKEKESFIEGAQWQQERMYSEEDMEEAFTNGLNRSFDSDFDRWIEQFKK